MVQIPGAAEDSGAPPDIRAIKPPVSIFDPWFLFWLSLVLLALALLGWWLWKRWRSRKPAASSIPVVPPHERAWQSLREALLLIDQPRPFCIAVSDAVRLYLEERFQLRAPERTTEEFLDEMQASAALTFDQKQTLGDFLAQCDLVKFARFEPGRDALQAIYETALRLVEETTPPEPAPDTGESTPAQQHA